MLGGGLRRRSAPHTLREEPPQAPNPPGTSPCPLSRTGTGLAGERCPPSALPFSCSGALPSSLLTWAMMDWCSMGAGEGAGGGGPPGAAPGGEAGRGRRRRGAAGAGAAPRRKLCYNMEFPPPGLGLQTWIPGAVSRNPLKGQRRRGGPSSFSLLLLLLLPPPPPPPGARAAGKEWGSPPSSEWFCGWVGKDTPLAPVGTFPTSRRALAHSPAPTRRAWRGGSALLSPPPMHLPARGSLCRHPRDRNAPPMPGVPWS